MGSKTVEEGKKKHYYYVSVLSVMSALAVIILHSNVAFWQYREGNAWAFNNIVESLFYFAVPIFFMLIGVTLFDYKDRYDTKTFFKHRFSKILIPFIFWSFFGLAFYNLFRGFNFHLDFISIWNDFFGYKYVGIFWFFFPLICIYLAIPLFASVDKKRKEKVLKYLAIVGIVINMLVPFILSIIGYCCGQKLSWGFSFTVTEGYLFYPIIGYLLHKKELTKKQRYLIYFLAFCGLMMIMVGTYCLSRHDGAINELFKEYKNFPCLLYSSGIFVLVKQIADKKAIKKMEKMVNILSRYTFAFYLLHSFVLVYMIDLYGNIGIEFTSMKYVPLAFLTTVPICLVITWIIRKIPGGKMILP